MREHLVPTLGMAPTLATYDLLINMSNRTIHVLQLL